MKLLWAPWRMSFFKEPKHKGCIFCDFPKETQDKKNLILHRGKLNYIIMNKYPYNTGHLMVVPLTHTANLNELRTAEMQEMMELAQKGMEALKQAYQPQGFNLGMNLGEASGAGIREHLHLHIVPRWAGDTNFMPIFGDTKVMPESMDATYDRIFTALEGKNS